VKQQLFVNFGGELLFVLGHRFAVDLRSILPCLLLLKEKTCFRGDQARQGRRG
jgi:hypothetical protein